MSRLLIVSFLSLMMLLSTGIAYTQDEAGSIVLARAKLYVQAGQYDEALRIYSGFRRLNPESIDALAQRAFVYASMNDFTSAFNDIDTAFDLAGFSAIKQALVYDSRGQVYYLEGNADLSLEDFSRAIELDSETADYWLSRATWYQLARDWDNALDDYRQVAILRPNDSEAFLNLARVYLVLNDFKASIESLDSAIEITPNDPELYIFRGSINLQNQQLAAAAVDYSNWLQMINVTIVEQDALLDPTTQLDLDMNYGTVHHVSFNASSGDRLGVVANSRGVDSLVVLLDPEGNPIIADDDGGQGLNAFIIDFALPDDGTYTLWVGHARGGWKGKIELTVQIVPAEGV